MAGPFGPPGGGSSGTGSLPPGVRIGPLYGVYATALQFTNYNPVLLIGYIGFESDTGKAKVGDDVTDWNTLAYWTP